MLSAVDFFKLKTQLSLKVVVEPKRGKMWDTGVTGPLVKHGWATFDVLFIKVMRGDYMR